MRIDDSKRLPLEQIKPQKRSESTSAPQIPNSAPAPSTDDVSRADKIEKLKQMFSAGQPIDVNKLADKLVESGILFDEKA